MTAPEVPWAEADVLHFMLRSRSAREHAIERLTRADFGPIGDRLFGAIRDLHDQGAPVGPGSVARAASAHVDTVEAFWQRSPHRTDLESVAALLEASMRRYLRTQLASIQQRLDDPTVGVGWFRDAVDDARSLLPSADAHVEVPNIGEMIASTDAAYDWLVPWMLERGERLMIVAPEGSGKTVLLRQWAFQLACGVHWATERIMPKARVLYVDAENSGKNIVRASRYMHRIASRHPDWQDDRLRIEAVWNLDITSSREQRDTIEGWIERYRPDLLVIGPIYKVGRNTRALSYEDAALAVTDVIDGWRHRYGIAVAMEHHAPSAVDGGGERTLNPFGSTVWRRWPDVGVGLKYLAPDDEHEKPRFRVQPFRGYRGTHLFPSEFEHGDLRQNDWPWVARNVNMGQYERDDSHESF